jgi:hypothetical protein
MSPQVNTIEDEVAKLATDYKAEEIAFFRAVVRLGLTPRGIDLLRSR